MLQQPKLNEQKTFKDGGGNRGRWPKTFGFVCINQSIAKKVLLKTMWEKQLSSCSRGLCTKYKHSTFFV